MALAVPRPGPRGLRPGWPGAPRGPGPGQVGPGEPPVWREQLPAAVLQRRAALCAGAPAPAPNLLSGLGEILGDGLLRGL